MVSMVEPGYRGIITPGWVRDRLWARAQRVPSLDLRFAANRSLRDAVTGRELVTFTRASNATVVGPTGLIETVANDVPRFQHDPLTGQCLGLLPEEQRANLLLNSETIGSTGWGTQGTAPTVTTNATSSPSGAVNANQITFAAADSRSTVASIPITTGVTYTISVYARAVGPTLNKFRISFFDQAAQGVSADLVASSTQWTRFSFSYTSTQTNSLGFMQLRNASDNLANDVYLWGAQLEAGAFPTSYIPTTGTSATRSADIGTLIGSPSNNIRTIYLELQSPASGVRGIASLNDNSANNRWELSTSGTDPKSDVVVGGVSQASIDGGTVTANVTTKIAARISGSGYAISVNGGAEVTAAAGSVPVFDRLLLGRNQAGNYLNGPIARIVGWSDSLMALHQLTR